MKLNPDCIRDILLTVEEHCGFRLAVEYEYGNPLFERLNAYSQEEVAYHIQQCEYSTLIHGVAFYNMGQKADILDLTPKGHEFLANIRNDTFFNKVKAICKELGTNSLEDIRQVSFNCAALLIKGYFNLP